MCHRIIRYSEQILVQRPARLPQLLRQRKAWQRSLEKVPAGRDVLYNNDMVTLTALLSQQIGKTVAFTSINAGFMIPPPPFSLVLLILLTPPSSHRTCDRVFEGQLLRCISPAILHRWIRLVLRHTVLMYGISSILLFPSVFIRGTPQNTRDYSHRVFYIWLNKKSSSLSVFVRVFKSFVFFSLICRSAKGPEPPVAKGGMEPRLHPAGLCRQHRHRAAFRPHGKRTLCHPSGNHASLPSLTSPNNPFPPLKEQLT